MQLLTSPLIEHAKLHGVLIRSSHEWETKGRPAWTDAVAALSARPLSRRVIGIDSEWFNKNPLATVQIASSTHCFVIHLSYLDNRILPDEVKQVLEDPTVIKCGVGVGGDASRLQKEQQVTVNSTMDIDRYSVMLELAEYGKTNLGALAHSVCGIAMTKDKMITRSNWELPLSAAQAAYAADDAVASYMIGDRIMAEAVCRLHLADTPANPFDAPRWLRQSAPNANVAFRQSCLKHQHAAARQRNAAAGTAEATCGSTGDGARAPVIPQGAIRVRVLDKDGLFLFDCSQGRAKFYVEEKGIALVTKRRHENPTKPLEIQLLFQNQTRTRLCMYAAVNQCELGEHCPFAHGVEQLCPASRALLTDPSTHTCAFCLSPSRLMRHAIVPPSFRRCLPKVLRRPKDDDYVPICNQCNTFVRRHYDLFMSTIHHEAEAADERGIVALQIVARCVRYARLLLDAKKLAKLPNERQTTLREFILENWKATRMYSVDDNGTITDGGVCNGTRSPFHGESLHCQQAPHGDGQKKESKKAAVTATATAAANTTDAEAFDEDWESLDQDEAGSTNGRSALRPPPLIGPQPAYLVDFNGSRIAVRDSDGEINPAFLERLSRVVPGDVRARATIATLVGRDVAKAEAFVERWRTFCKEDCGMVEKPSNHMTVEDWAAYSAKNGSPREARGKGH